MTRLFATFGVLGLAVGLAGADPAPGAPTPAELVAKLGSDDFAQREAAVVALEKAGAAAIPALREAVQSPDPEVRQRAAGILTKLQRAADSTGKLVAKKVALDYKDVPLGTAVNDLKARTGLNIVIDPTKIANPLRKVTCVTGEVPLWEAVEAFCAAAELCEVFRTEIDVPKVQQRRGYSPPQIPTPDVVPIVLVDGKHRSLPGDRRTAVRVLALPAAFPGHRVLLGTGETTLCFEIAPAPGLNWLDVSAVKIRKLTDDAGRAGGSGTPRPIDDGGSGDFEGGIVVFGGAGGFGGFGGRVRFDPRTGQPLYPDTVPNPRVVPVPLKLATPNAKSIKRLEGAILGEIVLTNQTLLTITDPAKSVGTPFDGAGQTRVTVTGIGETKTGGAIVTVQLQYPSPWSIGARRGWNPGGIWPEAPSRMNQTPSVQAFDAAGKAMSGSNNTGFTDSSDDGQTMYQTLTLTFRKDAGVPAKLVVVGPRPMVVEIPFVMENVPLP